ncbi:hypothetical protein SVAN01_11614, partial [Stagonosporopsis vannaccii]
FLAITLPASTLPTHLLLFLCFVLLRDDQTWVSWSLIYNGTATFASVLGLVGAIWSLPKLVSAYIFVHTTTLSFVTLALLDPLLPWDLWYMNPVITDWQADETAICRDMHTGVSWDEEWIVQCSGQLGIVLKGIAWGGFILVTAHWWALVLVRTWSNQLPIIQPRGDDVEKLIPQTMGMKPTKRVDYAREKM